MHDNDQDDKFFIDFDAREFIAIVSQNRKLVISTIILTTLSAATIGVLKAPEFTASATILPLERGASGNLSSMLSAMGGGLGALASQAGLSEGGTADKFVTIMRTRTLTESVITNKQLLPILFSEDWNPRNNSWERKSLPLIGVTERSAPSLQDAVARMRERTSFHIDNKSGTITVSFTAKSPTVAANVANAYVQELDTFISKTALTMAKKNRIFIEDQLNKAKAEMGDYEVALKEFQQKNRVVSLDAQAEAAVKAYADLKARLVSSEVELRLIERGAFEDDPRVHLKRQEVTELKKQLEEFENGNTRGPMVSFKQAPELGLGYARLKREILVRGKVFELLTQQFEMAKVEEAQSDISFQVLDTAIPPEKRSDRGPVTTILIAIISSPVIGVLLALSRHYLRNLRVAV